MKNRFLLYVILFVSFFSSCDPHNEYKMFVKNETTYSINVKPKEVIITPNNIGLIYEYFGMGGPGSNGYCEIGPGNVGTITIEIQSHPELQVIKNLSDKNSWLYTNSGNGRKGYKVECVAVIKQSDIVPK